MKNIVVVGALMLLSVPALAHIELTSPPNRYSSNGLDGMNKECPCGFNAVGVTAGDQLCSNGVTSDSHRSTHVTTLVAGAQTTVTWVETIGHSGRMRIAFDPDGADLADFNAHILVDISDPIGSTGKNCTVNSSPTDVTCTSSGSSTWSATFTLPSTPCSNCTLQVIQDMSGDTTDPVTDPSGQATYFQCADLILTGAEGEGEGEGTAGEGEGAAGEGEGAAGEGEGAAGEGEGAAGEGEGAAGEGEGEGEGEGSTSPPAPLGCASVGSEGGVLVVGLVGLAVLRRRRQTR